jgi:hypothetical protein
MASPPQSAETPSGLPAIAPPPQASLPAAPLAVDYSEGMHLAPGYREFLTSLIVRGGELVDVHRTAWRKAFPDEPVPQPVRDGGDDGGDDDPDSGVEDGVLSAEEEELSEGEPFLFSDSSASDGGADDGHSLGEEDRPLRRRRLL